MQVPSQQGRTSLPVCISRGEGSSRKEQPPGNSTLGDISPPRNPPELWCCSVAKTRPTLWDHMNCSMPGFPVLHCLLEFAQTHVYWVDHAIQPSQPLSSPSLQPSLFPNIRVFSNELILGIRWPKYWSVSFSISSSNEYSQLIFFRIDWFDLAVQGTLKSLLQHHNLKASVFQCSAFFLAQLLHLYTTTG